MLKRESSFSQGHPLDIFFNISNGHSVLKVCSAYTYTPRVSSFLRISKIDCVVRSSQPLWKSELTIV